MIRSIAPMLSDFESILESIATVAAVVLIPIYMGFMHISPAGAVAYAGVGGTVMAVGEHLQFDHDVDRISLWDVGLWAAAIAGTGGLAYLLALLLI